MIEISVSPECDLMMTGLLESIACFPWTANLKSASSCFDIRLSMELTFYIENSWQYLSVDRHRLVVLSVFNVSLLLSISQLKKSLISWDLFPFSCRKELVSRILTFADLRIVNDPSPLAALGELSKKFSCNYSRSTLPQSLRMMDNTLLMNSSSVNKVPTARITAVRSTMYAPTLAYASSSTTWV